MRILPPRTLALTTEEFSTIAANWLAIAKHPRFHRLYTELVYQPMLELLKHLRAKGFKTFIVSGGGIDFIRTNSERIYGIPPSRSSAPASRRSTS